ncbi:MAG: helix-turn-helix domain-containing protein [Actinomycetota bacterium]|nr:helix-turn-helix domain-containing protein [Actinomycetota bacterium]
MAATGRPPRFLTLTDVAEILNTSTAQVSALVKRKDLRAMKIGGRGQWRVEVDELESYIQRAYVDTELLLDGDPEVDDLSAEFSPDSASSRATGPELGS